MANAAAIVKRLSALKSDRVKHEDVWRECFLYSWPSRADGLNAERKDAQQIQDDKARLVDSTSTDAGRILASAIMSGATPANSRWFSLDVYGADEAGRRWLDDAAQTLFELIHGANFDAAGYECCVDLVGAGWFVLYIDEGPDGLRFEEWPIAQCYPTASKPGGAIDTLYRNYQMTALQLVSEYGENGVSEKTRKLAQDKPDELVELVRAIEPRRGVVPGNLARNLPIQSCTIEVATQHLLRESGYHETPVAVPRWMLIPNTPYALGPMADALPDIKMLNDLKRMQLAAADIAVAGMWIAADDGVLNPRTVKIGPRKIVIANSVDSMKALETGSDFQLSDAMVRQIQNAIRKTLMADLLESQDAPTRTATEVNIRIGIIRQVLAPVFGRLQAEYLSPMIERCFGLAYRAGVLGQPPESIAGRSFRVKYISPLARAQKLEDVTAIERFSGNIGAIAQFKPGILDLIDEDETGRTLAEALGVPMKTLLDADSVQALRDQRAQQAQQAAQRAQAQQTQQAIGQAALDRAVA